jgi:hypothetical protein
VALNSEEIGAPCQQAQARAEGESALALKSFSKNGAIAGITYFQPGGFGGPQDQRFGCGVVISAKGREGIHWFDGLPTDLIDAS